MKNLNLISLMEKIHSKNNNERIHVCCFKYEGEEKENLTILVDVSFLGIFQSILARNINDVKVS